MISQVITEIQDELSSILDENQMKCLVKVLEKHLSPLEEAEKRDTTEKNDMLPVFIAAKRVEGCSEKSLRYYESTIRNMLESIMLTLQKSYTKGLLTLLTHRETSEAPAYFYRSCGRHP